MLTIEIEQPFFLVNGFQTSTWMQHTSLWHRNFHHNIILQDTLTLDKFIKINEDVAQLELLMLQAIIAFVFLIAFHLQVAI